MFSRYRILGKLGAGGMGVVLRAEDISLKRPVALKFLSGTALSQEQTRARFLREAQTAAALNHPNVCTIYEVGEVQKGEERPPGADERLEAGTPFIAMELIEGRTLEAMVRQSGSLPLEDLLGIALQIADGMAAAHARGIVHRDLKPGNVMIANEGRVKILDFGLAKPLEPAGPGDAAGTAAATASAELTREGRVIGTAAYMSPEQAKGEPVDARSDIFSFGVMLYELATGTRPFRGTTTLSTLAKIIEAEPEPIPESRADIPQELRRIVRRCLQKDPEDRYNDTRDLVAALKALRQETTSGAPKMASGAPPARLGTLQRRRVALRIAAAAAAVIGVAAVAIIYWPKGVRRAAPLPPTHRQLTFSADAFSPDLSRDGKSVLYIRRAYGKKAALVVQDVTGGQPLEILHGDVQSARWSPSGTEILSIARNDDGESSAAVVPRLGGPPRPLAVAVTSNVRWYGAWSPDGTRVAIASEDGKVALVEVATGRSTSLPALPDVPFIFDIDWAPNGGRLAVVTGSLSEIRTFSENGTSMETVVHGLGNLSRVVRWTERGDGVYFLREGGQTTDLWRAPVDAATGRSAGEPRPVLTGLMLGGWLGIAADGRAMAYSRTAGSAHIWLLERASDPRMGGPKSRALTSGTLEYGSPTLSPDGRTVAFTAGTGGKTNIFTIDLVGGAPRQITYLDGACSDPAWSPDGKRLAFVSDHDGTARVWVIDAAGGAPKAYGSTTPSRGSGEIQWAPGARIIYRSMQNGARNFSLLDPSTGSEERLMPDPPEGWVILARVAPDGNRIGFVWNRPPHRQIWFLARDQGKPRLLLDAGAAFPIDWSADGKWLYVLDYSAAGNRIARVSPDGDSAETVVDVPFEVAGNGDGSVSADGRAFVVPRIDRTSDVWLAENFDPESPR